MSAVNAGLRGLFDALLYPFRGLPPAVGLVVLSLVTAIVMLLVYKKVSNQKGLEAVKRKIHASLFEIRLFNDDFRAILRAQLDILRHNLDYLRLSLVPMFFILPPLVLVIAQLQFHYGYAGLAAGGTTIVEVRLAEGWESGGKVGASATGKPEIGLEAPAGVTLETPGVWVPAERTISWRVRVDEPGDGDLTVTAGGERLAKSFRNGPAAGRRSPLRPGRSFWDQLIYPAEPPLPAGSPVEQISLTLPSATVNLFGWKIHEWADVPAWMIVFFVLSIVFAFALRKPFRVQI